MVRSRATDFADLEEFRPETSFLRHVFRKLKMGRPRSFRLGYLERLPNSFRYHIRATNRCIPLGDRFEHGDDIDKLVGFLVHPQSIGLAGNSYQRSTIKVSIGDRRKQIGSTGSDRGQADTGFAGKAPVYIGHEACPLFMPGQDKLNAGFA